MSSFKSTEQPEYVRQSGSSAVLNIDTASFNRYKEERSRIFKIDSLANEVQTLQRDMGDIKMLLQQLVNGKTNG